MYGSEKTNEIIKFARELRTNWGRDPFIISDICGIKVTESKLKDKKDSSTISVPGYPTIIYLCGFNTPLTARILCAHELGHALLHKDITINRFNGDNRGISYRCEYEANLFAVALLFDEEDFNIPFNMMNNSMLKSILDYNIEV